MTKIEITAVELFIDRNAPGLFRALASGASHQARDAFLLQGSAFAVCLDPACDAEIDTLPKCGPHAVIPRRNDHRR
jgi:hypothetical protein